MSIVVNKDNKPKKTRQNCASIDKRLNFKTDGGCKSCVYSIASVYWAEMKPAGEPE